MSYSFNVCAATLALAAAAVGTELDKVEAQQPIHARDREATNVAVGELLALVAEPGEGKALTVSVCGSCYAPVEGEPLDSVSLSIHIGMRPTTT